jgi:hypothetical protein
MEVPHTILCLYSKFSVNSKNFLDLMNNNNIDYVIPVCIDNKDMRNRIISSSYQIQYVPCLLLIYGSGSIEKYEGEMAFRWLTEIINNLKKNKEEEVLPKEPEQTPIVIEQPKKKKKVQIEKEESEDEEESEEEEIPEPPKKVKKNKVVKVSEQTSIDDLIDLGETLKSEQKTPAIKDSGNSNLMSRVQEMQRLRDAEDAKIGKNKPF